MGQVTFNADPPDEKTAQMIQLAAAATARSEGAVHSHTRRALEAGAQAEAIRHALILLASTTGFPGVIAALTWANDVIGDQQARTFGFQPEVKRSRSVARNRVASAPVTAR